MFQGATNNTKLACAPAPPQISQEKKPRQSWAHRNVCGVFRRTKIYAYIYLPRLVSLPKIAWLLLSCSRRNYSSKARFVFSSLTAWAFPRRARAQTEIFSKHPASRSSLLVRYSIRKLMMILTRRVRCSRMLPCYVWFPSRTSRANNKWENGHYSRWHRGDPLS